MNYRQEILHGNLASYFKGRIIAYGSPDMLRNDPHPALRQLLEGSIDGPLTDRAVSRSRLAPIASEASAP